MQENETASATTGKSAEYRAPSAESDNSTSHSMLGTQRSVLSTLAGSGAAVGAGLGGLVGAVVGWLLGAPIVPLPTIGPVVGQGVLPVIIGGLLLGAGIGALVGALVGVNLPNNEINEVKVNESKVDEGQVVEDEGGLVVRSRPVLPVLPVRAPNALTHTLTVPVPVPVIGATDTEAGQAARQQTAFVRTEDTGLKTEYGSPPQSSVLSPVSSVLTSDPASESQLPTKRRRAYRVRFKRQQ